MRLLPVLALLGGAANEADAAFRSSRLRLKLLGQEVADLQSRGELTDAVRDEEAAAVQAEEAATHAAEASAKALRARRVSLAQGEAVLAGLGRLAHAKAADAEAARLGRRATRLQKKLRALQAKRRSLAGSAASAEKARAHADDVRGKVPAELTAERTRARADEAALKKAARAKLERLQAKERAARARRDQGEVAALRWEEGHVKAALEEGRSRAHEHERDLAARLYVAKKQAPLLTKKVQHLRAKLARVSAAAAAVERRATADAASAQNLTAQAALERLQGSTAAAGRAAPNATLADVRQELVKLDAEINGRDAQVEEERAQTAADQRALGAQRQEPAAADLSLDGSALDTALATDASDY